jgi:hypothetical protein
MAQIPEWASPQVRGIKSHCDTAWGGKKRPDRPQRELKWKTFAEHPIETRMNCARIYGGEWRNGIKDSSA